MFNELDRRTSLTGNQIKILAAAIIGDALEFFDYFLIGFVLAFLIGPWKLTFGQSATVLMSSGIGAILGAYAWGWLADRIGRRIVFIGTVLNFSIATGLLYFTPDNGWVYLAVMRFFVGTGVGGLYCVDLPLVQEFMPSSKRGWVGGLVTCVIPLGVGVGAVLGAFMGTDQWRLLFAIGVLPALVVLLVRLWVPESPRWLCRQGRYEEARKSLAWALQVDPVVAADADRRRCRPDRQDELARPLQISAQPPRVLARQCRLPDWRLWDHAVGAIAVRAVVEGRPQQAAKMMILLTIFGFIGRVSFSYFSELMGRRKAGGLLGFGAGVLTIVAGYNYNVMWGEWSAFWLILAVGFFFADGGFAIVGPYAAEIWPSHLRTSGMGSAYGFGGIGKILGPVGLALIVGSNNYLKPDVPLPEIPLAFIYLGCWFLMAGIVYYFFGIETRGKSIEEIDRELNAGVASVTATAQVRGIELNMLVATSAELAGDLTWSRVPKPSARRSRPPPTKSSRAGGCRRPCSTNCMRRSCFASCCRAHPGGSRPIPSPSSMSSKPSRKPTHRRPGASARPAAARCRRPISICRWHNRSSARTRGPCWPGGRAPGVKAIECEGGYRVTGVWAFASGGRKLGAGVGAQIALARRESPAKGGRLAGPGQSPRDRNAAHPHRISGNRDPQRMARHLARARNRLPDRRRPGRGR